ncbi:MAG: MFS transporter, partial [Bdellovibrionales bacterium]|nr:MFS transporter [Bdellovibrionales bacterium]
SCRWILPLTGSLWLLRFGLMIMGVGAAAIGQSESLMFLIFGSALLGIGQGVTAVSQHTLIQENSPESQWRRLFSGLHSTYGFASLLAPLAFSNLMGMDWHWSRAFVVFSLIPMVVLASSGFLAARRVPATPPVRHKVMGDPVGRQYFWVALFLAGYLVGELSISTRLVLLLQRGRGFNPDQAAHALTAFFLLLFLSRLFFFVKPISRWTSRRILQFCLVSSFIAYALGLTGHSYWFVLCGAVMGPFFPVTMEMMASLFGVRSGHALSLAMSFGTFSIVLMHYGLGLLSDWFSLQSALWLGPLSLVISLVVLSTCVTKNPLSSH